MDQRDIEVAAWNDALATGDNAVIGTEQTRLLDSVHRRIMDEDANYTEAGWTVR